MSEKFMFFENFKETADKLPDDLRLKFYDGLTNYVFKGIEPDDAVINALVNAIKPSLDKVEKRGGNHNPTGQNQHRSGQKEVKVGQSGQSFLETETRNKKQETETETEDILISSDKSSEIKIDSSPNQKKYAFEGKIIKLNQKDFDNWQKAYPDLNLYGECLQRDIWLSKQPPDATKDWFISTSQYFLKQNEIRKRQNAELDEKLEEPKSSIFDDEPKKEHDWSWV